MKTIAILFLTLIFSSCATRPGHSQNSALAGQHASEAATQAGNAAAQAGNAASMQMMNTPPPSGF